MNKIPKFLLDNIENIRQAEDVNFKIGKPYFNERYMRNHIISDILSTRKTETINREFVTNYFKNNQVLHGFYAAMIWGGISTGGQTGDNLTKLITSDQNRIIKNINQLKTTINNNNFKDAFEYMSDSNRGKFDGIGPAYFTKLFFFLANASQQKITPPILDKWTSLAYYNLSVEIESIDAFKDSVRIDKDNFISFKDNKLSSIYLDYTKKMNNWASALQCSVDHLERFIFGVDRRTNQTEKNPRIAFLRNAKKYFNNKHNKWL